MQAKKKRIQTQKMKRRGWRKVKFELTTVMPHLEQYFIEGRHLPEGWARYEDGKLVEAIYVDWNPDTRTWSVNHYPSGDVLYSELETKDLALSLARDEVLDRVES